MLIEPAPAMRKNKGKTMAHLRISDGSPVHSHGFARLKDSFNVKAAAAVTVGSIGIASIFSPDNLLPHAFATAIGTLSGALAGHIFLSADPEEKKSCYNTTPHSTFSNINLNWNRMKKAKYVQSALFLTAACLFMTSSNRSSLKNVFWITHGLSLSAIYAGDITRRNKVSKGEWSLEQIPPPKKQTETVKESWLEKLKSWKLAPVKVQAHIDFTPEI